MNLFHILFVIKTPSRGRKNPLKFASLPTCGFVAQLVERPTSIWEARVQASSKPEFFSGFIFCNFFNCSLPARINSSLITRRSKMNLFHILFVIKTPSRGRKDPLKFASLPTCGFVAQLVERPTSIWEARVQAPSKPEFFFFSGFIFCNFFNCSLPARINSSLITRRSNMNLFHILFVIKTPSRGRKDPLKFASLPTCGFVAQLVERPTSIWEARVQAPSKPEFFFFSGFIFCNFFNCSLPARINSSLITRRSNMNLFHILFVIKAGSVRCCGRALNGGGLDTRESDVFVMFINSVLHWSSSLADVNFTAFTWNSVSHAILFRGLIFMILDTVS